MKKPKANKKPMWPDRCVVCNAVIKLYDNDSPVVELCVFCRELEAKLDIIGKRIMR